MRSFLLSSNEKIDTHFLVVTMIFLCPFTVIAHNISCIYIHINMLMIY
jgi:hypothetical protein